jgi:copper chaperone CopZ
MKRFFSIFFLTIVAYTASAQITKATLQASGLTCSMCNLSIKKSIEKLSFIESIVPNIETASYELTFKKGATVNFQEIRKAVEKAGFSVAQLSFTVNFDLVNNFADNTFKIDGFVYKINGNQSFNATQEPIEFYITDKGFLNEKRYNKFKNFNTSKENENIINITQL